MAGRREGVSTARRGAALPGAAGPWASSRAVSIGARGSAGAFPAPGSSSAARSPSRPLRARVRPGPARRGGAGGRGGGSRPSAQNAAPPARPAAGLEHVLPAAAPRAAARGAALPAGPLRRPRAGKASPGCALRPGGARRRRGSRWWWWGQGPGLPSSAWAPRGRLGGRRELLWLVSRGLPGALLGPAAGSSAGRRRPRARVQRAARAGPAGLAGHHVPLNSPSSVRCLCAVTTSAGSLAASLLFSSGVSRLKSRRAARHPPACGISSLLANQSRRRGRTSGGRLRQPSCEPPDTGVCLNCTSSSQNRAGVGS